MRKQSTKTDEPGRVVLEGVPRVHFYDGGPQVPEDEMFPACLKACLQFMGEDFGSKEITEHRSTWHVDNLYVYIMGTSGAAFRLMWHSQRWDLANTSTNIMAADALEPVRRAFEAVGYAHEAFGNQDSKLIGHEGVDFFTEYRDYDYLRSRIIESIRDRRRPVIAFGVIGPPAACVITGYDEHGEVIVGWNFFQVFPEFATAVDVEPSGYFRKADWFEDTQGLIIIGEKQERPSPGETYRKALRWALEIVRTPLIHDYHSGLAAYDAWADALLRDEDFPVDDADTLRERHMVHNDAVGTLAEARWYASLFSRQVAEDEPAMAVELLAAAECYEAEHDLMWDVWDLMGGRDFSDELVNRLAEPAVRRQIAPLILQARDRDAEAADYVEEALAR